MKILAIFCFFGLLCLGAQAPAPAAQPPKTVAPPPGQPGARTPQPPTADVKKPEPVPPGTVVATVEGKQVTAAELDKIISNLPTQIQQNALKNKKDFVQQYFLLKKLAEMAASEKLDEKSPYKEQLEWGRMQLLLNAKINEMNKDFPVSSEDQKTYYEGNKDRYTQAKIKVIYLPFTALASPPTAAADPKAKKPMTEAEAKAKADTVVKQVREGADFVKMVKEHSEDAASAGKDGDFGQPIRKSDSLPEPIKTTIFAMKPGQVSDPVRQPNGFYIFRMEELTTRTYDEVKDEIFKELKQTAFNKWFEGQREKTAVKIENDAYFKQ